jgi:tripartite-type tricarboxylate transporter receptor subunit TctC
MITRRAVRNVALRVIVFAATFGMAAGAAAQNYPDHAIRMIVPNLYAKLPFDAERDFAAVSLAAYIPQLIAVNPNVPIKNIAELVAYAKAHPGKLNYGSVGVGSPSHIAGELLKLKTGIDMVHVPYKGGGPAVTAALGGQIEVLIVSMPAAYQHVKAGKLRPIAVASDKRSIAAPEIPTIVEQGVDCVVNSWYGALVPAKTPPAVIAKLNEAMKKALETPATKEKLLAQGAEAAWTTPAQFDALMKDELAKWEYVIREAKIQPE